MRARKMGLNIALLIFVIVTWGYSWVLMKIGLRFMGPLTFATWRCLLGGLAMIPVLYMKGVPWPPRGRLFDYAAVGFFQTTAMFGFILYGMRFVTAGKTAVLLYTMPIWTSFLVHFYLKERLTAQRWLGVVIGTVGILCILGWDTLVKQNLKILLGEFLVIVAAVSWAVANIWVKKRMIREDSYMVNGLQMLIGSVGLALISLPTEGLLNVTWTWLSVGVILFTGIVASTINFTIWFYLLRKLDIHTATFSSMLVPVFGLLFDWLQLGNRLDTGVIIGGILILVGIYQISNQKSPPRPRVWSVSRR
ncbi:MAG TPA: DMT family transporter [Thermodesulfobacteriota bacterium]|nr:DMT family transporter [Thermodesulfobacteriota bacterium]